MASNNSKYHVICAIDNNDFSRSPPSPREPGVRVEASFERIEDVRENIGNIVGKDEDDERIPECIVIRGTIIDEFS